MSRGPAAGPAPTSVPLEPRLDTPAWVLCSVLGATLVLAVAFEARTSALQSFVLSRWAGRLSYQVQPGRSPAIAFPAAGPFDEAGGYTRLRAFERRLSASGYRVAAQARWSPELLWIARRGVRPPFRAPARTGLVVRGRYDALLHDALARRRGFGRFEDVPGVVVKSLLFIENRELADPPDPRTNPAVEWDRLARAALLYAGGRLGLSSAGEGGSTLATQIEKYRHSPRGRTASPAEKLRQITAASLRAYHQGTDTRPERRAIILDYLNSMPLAATRGWGEVHGLGDGLWAWFGMDLDEVARDVESGDAAVRARALKHVLALVCAVRAPSRYLLTDRAALVARIDGYARLLEEAGVIEGEIARRLRDERLAFVPRAPSPSAPDLRRLKAANAVRNELLRLLGVAGYHQLDDLHLEAESTLDLALQDEVAQFLRRLADARFVQEHGLRQERLLAKGDPARVLYSVLLFERTPAGNVVRVQADNVDQAFDLNQGMMLELGSTAKLRTLAHYLEVMARLHRELAPLGDAAKRAARERARDPLTRWAAATLLGAPELARQAFVERALDRSYSASPHEVFFTGGGNHRFANFDPKDDGRVLSVREATWKSTNLVFVRLLRELVEFHAARLPFDARAVLHDPRHPERARLLASLVAAEGEWILGRRQRRAQDRRLRIRVEQDAFVLVEHEWRRLGFPFPHLVPSLATALGSSCDRPEALAELVGILLNDGVRRPTLRMRRLRFAAGTPYETLMEVPATTDGVRVMDPATAHALRALLGGVVERGTARRLSGAFQDRLGRPLQAGGKTGSGDNRHEKLSRSGIVLRSTARNRTAAFVFFLGERHFGVVTAFVPGPEADGYRFTSALPVALLRLLSPVLQPRLGSS